MGRKGFMAPKGSRVYNGFVAISVEEMHYCKSHNFCYDDEEQNKRLHFGLPCFYTDSRYIDGNGNFYRNCYIKQRSRKNPISLKSAFRRIEKVKGLPVGTKVEIEHSHYKKGKKKDFGLGYNYIVKKENPISIRYEVSHPEYFANFTEDDKARELTNLLRDAGFLVQVWNKNPNFIYGESEGEIAIAYGDGLRVGYSSGENSFRGYGNGCKNVLFDKWDEFNKWSQCMEIEKTLTNEEILKVLLYEAIK